MPDESVVPVETGNGYRDYLLSTLVSDVGRRLLFVRLLENGDIKAYTMRNIGSSKTYVFRPISEHLGHSMTGYTDAIIRLYDKHLEPVWYALFYEGSLSVNLL